MAQTSQAVTVSDLCYDVTLVTTSAYLACTSCQPASTGSYCNAGINFRNQDPVNCITWDQANYYCTGLGKRLPREEEYEWVARGGLAGTTYPWGNTAPTAADSPEKLCWSAEIDRQTGWPARPTGTCPVGSYLAAGASPLGINDLVGDVWEWTTTLYDSTGYVVRGGGWDNYDPTRVTAGFRNGPVPASTVQDALGFRCVRSPQ